MLEDRIAIVLRVEKEAQNIEQKLEETNVEELGKQHLALVAKIKKSKEIKNAQESQLIKLPVIEKENDELRKIVANVQCCV